MVLSTLTAPRTSPGSVGSRSEVQLFGWLAVSASDAPVHDDGEACITRQELGEQPEECLRVTLGLRREQGRWSVTHDHHSFADTTD